MSLIALASVKGAPGVTTTAVALGVTWPKGRRVVVAEVDAGGGDLAARHGLAAEPGVASLAGAARRPLGPGAATRHVQALSFGLDVLVAPPRPTEMAVALAGAEGLAGALRALPGADVVLDAGRVSASSPVLALLSRADAVAVLVRPSVCDLGHLGEALGALAGVGVPTRLVLRGRGPYGARAVAAAFGVPVLGRVPDDAESAQALNGAVRGRRGLRYSRLIAEAQTLAHELCRLVGPDIAPAERVDAHGGERR